MQCVAARRLGTVEVVQRVGVGNGREHPSSTGSVLEAPPVADAAAGQPGRPLYRLEDVPLCGLCSCCVPTLLLQQAAPFFPQGQP